MASTSLTSHAARGGAITITGQIAKFLIQTVGLLVLSRLLTPEIFGVIAVMTALVAFTELFRDFGLTPAAIQASTLSARQATNLFWVNTLIGAGAGAALAIAGVILAPVFGQPELALIAPFVGISSLFMGMQAQYQVALSRTFRFATMTITEVAAQLVAVAAAITAAALGAGIWALVLQTVLAQLSLLLLRSTATRWLPGLPRRHVELRPFFRYGANLFGAQLLSYLAGNVDTYLIGLRWGVAPLGQYNRAFTLMSLPIRQALNPLTNVLLPVLSRLKDDDAAFYRLLLRAQFALGASVSWVFAVAAVLSTDLVLLALGDQWTSAANLFGILAIGGVFQMFSHISYWVFLAKGATRSLLHYNLLTKSLTVVALVAASFVSIEAVAWAYTVSLALSWPINLLWLAKGVGMPGRRFFNNGAQILCAAGLSVAALFALRQVAGGPVIIVWCAAALAVFVVLLWLLPSTRSQFRDVATVARKGASRLKMRRG